MRSRIYIALVLLLAVLSSNAALAYKPGEKGEKEPAEVGKISPEKAAAKEYRAKRLFYTHHINAHYAEQLTNPQKKTRHSLAQFGYNLELLPIPFFPITSFIKPDGFGEQSYGKPSAKEHNGSLYTCRGGFMDFSHIRCAADWTVYLAFSIITNNTDFDLPAEGGTLKLHFNNLNKLTLEDVVDMAQKIAYERLVWHEIASWHYHRPNYVFSEQQSTFTPEDLYSDLLGTKIGRDVALRILKNQDTLSYSQITGEEIDKTIASLQPVTSKKTSARAYDMVDRQKQMKLPADKRNSDVWYDSGILFTDERYVFKRDMDLGAVKQPWLVPNQEQLGCSAEASAEVLQVPQHTRAGVSLYNYYEFCISPDSVLFFNKKNGKQLHPVIAAFSTKNMEQVENIIYTQMEEKLLPDFDIRNGADPVASFKGVKRVLFK